MGTTVLNILHLGLANDAATANSDRVAGVVEGALRAATVAATEALQEPQQHVAEVIRVAPELQTGMARHHRGKIYGTISS